MLAKEVVLLPFVDPLCYDFVLPSTSCPEYTSRFVRRCTNSEGSCDIIVIIIVIIITIYSIIPLPLLVFRSSS